MQCRLVPSGLSRRCLVRWFATAIACATIAPVALAVDAVDPATREAVEVGLEPLITGIAAQQDPRVAAAIARIDGTGRRLLALRGYLRGKARLAERWSWTAEQVAAYASTPEHAALQAEIARVQAAFAQANPGFELWVNPQVRSLDVQLQNWNSNDSVTAAAAGLLTSAQAWVQARAFERKDVAAAERALEEYLVRYLPVPTPTIAAPGLSPHGQMRAIDFQVQHAGAIVAGPRTSTIALEWDGAGWTEKLEAAVRSGSRHFVGPLASPREPWHYTYAPDAVAAQ